MFHVYVSCSCFMFMFHVHVSCSCFMFMFHVYVSERKNPIDVAWCKAAMIECRYDVLEVGGNANAF